MALLAASIARKLQGHSCGGQSDHPSRMDFQDSFPSLSSGTIDLEGSRFLDYDGKSSTHHGEIVPYNGFGAELTKARPSWIISADSSWKSRWDWWIILIVIYNSIMIPWSFSFLLVRKPLQEAVDYIFDCFFLADILLTFRTAFMDRHGNEIRDRKEIRRRYLKTWFWADLVAVFPFELFVIAAKVNLSLSMLNLFKLPRLLRLGRLSKKIDRLSMAKNLRILYLLAGFALFAHWIACAWFFLGRFQSQVNVWSGSVWLVNSGLCQTIKGEGNWIDGEFVATNKDEVGTYHMVNGVVSCIKQDRPEHRVWRIDSTSPVSVTRSDNQTVRIMPDAGVWTQFIASYYWSLSTLTTVGFGDIPPTTNAERVFTIIIMLVGAIMYATIFGNVAVLIHTFDTANARYKGKVDAIKEFGKFYDIDRNILNKLLAYHAKANLQNRGINVRIMTDELPANFKGEVLVSMLKTFIQCLREKSPWIGNNELFLAEMLDRIDGRVCLEGDYLAIENVFQHDLYFVAKGNFEIRYRCLEGRLDNSDRSQDILIQLGPGEYVGRECLQASGVEFCHVQAACHGELFQMSASNFRHLERLFQEDVNALRSYSLARINAKVRKARKRNGSTGNVSLSEVETVLKEAKERVSGGSREDNRWNPSGETTSSTRSSTISSWMQDHMSRIEANVQSIERGLEAKLRQVLKEVLQERSNILEIADQRDPSSREFVDG